YSGQNGLKQSLILAEMIRSYGWCVEIPAQGGSLKNQLKKADRLGVHIVLILGDQEIETATVVVKHMGSGNQETVSVVNLHDHLQSMRFIP
ncbi:MAG: histidine--tRNA ligase, partial [Magnetococcales bacterium]|nr:histidine--tRNA ligase [Magnetococcales bacterium]